MIIWGSRGDVLELGDLGVRRCPVCQADRSFKIVLTYRYSHIWFLFGRVTSQKYLEMCTICRRGPEIPRENVRNLVSGSPIPFMRRFGWLILVVVVVGFVLFMVFSGTGLLWDG